MANATCSTSIDLCALRVSRLNASGSPHSGASNGYVTDAAIKLGIGVTLSTGDDFEQKNGCGDICSTFKQPDKIKRLELSMDLCQLDAELLSLLTGAARITSGSTTVGMQYPAVTGADPDPVCIEAWSKAWDGGSQATPSILSNAAAYVHWVFPFTRWAQDTQTVEHQLLVTPVKGTGEENDRITVNGPFDDWPAYVAAAGGITRIGGWFLDATIPSATCGFISVTSSAS